MDIKKFFGDVIQKVRLTPGATQLPLAPREPGMPARMGQMGQMGNQQRGVTAVPTGGVSRYGQTRNQPPNTIADVDPAHNYFSPLQPVRPLGPPSTTWPRIYDYPVGVNLEYAPARMAHCGTLRTLSTSWGVLRTVIETRKDQLVRIPWHFKTVATGKSGGKENANTKMLMKFFEKPDRSTHFDAWLRMILDDHLVIDGATLYNWPSKAGIPYAIDVIDGATIKPLIDDAGRRPILPNPAYQQIIKGMPMNNFTMAELLYAPANPRSYSPLYGYSRVDQVMMEVVQGLLQTLYQTNFWKEGNIPDLMVSVPETWSAAQTASFQSYFDALLEGNLNQKSKMRFVPGGVKPFELRGSAGDLLKTDQQEWLARVVCFAFSIPPSPFIRDMNRSTAETAKDSATEEGLFPLMQWLKRAVMDPIVHDWFKMDDIEFLWDFTPDVDQAEQATTFGTYVDKGILKRNEVREKLNMPPDKNPIADMLTITGSAMLLADVGKTPEPAPGLPGAVGPDGKPLPPKVGPDGKPVKVKAKGQPVDEEDVDEGEEEETSKPTKKKTIVRKFDDGVDLIPVKKKASPLSRNSPHSY